MMHAVDAMLADARRGSRTATSAAWILALVLLLALAGVLSAAGVVPALRTDPTVGVAWAGDSGGTGMPLDHEDGSSEGDAVVHAAWDGPATHLDWSNRGYSTVESSFVGQRVATPGDRTRRTLMLTNDGPAAAGLAVSLRLDEGVPGGARNPGLADEVELFWNVGGVEGHQPFSVLRDESGGLVDVAEVQVAAGETVAVEIGFELAAATSLQRNEGQASTELAFDVVATMSGAVDEQPNRLATTGAGSLMLFLIAAVLLLLAGLLLVARRRQRCDDCARTLDRGESWVHLWEPEVGRRRVCPECAVAGTTAAGASHH